MCNCRVHIVTIYRDELELAKQKQQQKHGAINANNVSLFLKINAILE